MKTIFTKTFGASWRTSLTGYTMAAIVAVFPLMNCEVNFHNKASTLNYSIKLLLAAVIAIHSKNCSDEPK